LAPPFSGLLKPSSQSILSPFHPPLEKIPSITTPQGFVIRLLAVVHDPPPAAQSSLHPEPNSGEKILDNVFVISGNGTTINMGPVKLLITVAEFREQYCSRREQDAEFCRLVYLGKQLEDKKDGVGE
jgi:hypothetical protein